MATPHNRAQKGEIAKTVLMPGDPLRAKFVAETYLTDVKVVSDVRNVYAYTGLFQGVPVSVMASGMGMGSIGIYSYELYKEYDVDTIIRIGSAGAYSEELNLYDVLLGDSAWSASTYAQMQNGCMDDVLYPDQGVNELILQTGEKLGVPITLGRIHSSDVFYAEANVDDFREIHRKHGCKCVEMESFALFHNANVLGKKAACLLTISDSLCTKEETTPQERQTAFTKMMDVALHTAKTLGEMGEKP